MTPAHRSLLLLSLMFTNGILKHLVERPRPWLTVEGLTLTIRPTPTYTISRPLFYGAAHVLDESDAYPYLTGPEVELVMLRAQASALMTLANAAALEAWKYSLGDESVDKTGLAKTLMEQATAAQKLYLDEMRRAVGPVVRVAPSRASRKAATTWVGGVKRHWPVFSRCCHWS